MHTSYVQMSMSRSPSLSLSFSLPYVLVMERLYALANTLINKFLDNL